MRKPREIHSFPSSLFPILPRRPCLSFDYTKGRWRWDLGKIRAKGHSDNVVDLMVEKLNRLPAETRFALQQFACIGNSADFDTLAICLETTEDEVHADLWAGFASRVGFAA